jgi:hypothetical protein
MRVVRDDLIHAFFEDEPIPDCLTLILDIEGCLSIKHHKKLDDLVPSPKLHPTKHTLNVTTSRDPDAW